MITLALTALLGLIAAAFCSRRRRSIVKGPPLPPGPKPKFLIGNLFDIPHEQCWERFAEWWREYGDVVYLSIMGRDMILLNTLEAANDLLDKRSLIYSDRPHFPMGDLVDMRKFNFGFMSYGKDWQLRRKTFANHYAKSVPSTAEPNRVAALLLLQRLRSDPAKWQEHLNMHATQVTLDVTYGITVTSSEDPVVKANKRAMDTVSNIILRPDMWIFNLAHILRNWPTALGGWYIQQMIKNWHKQFVDLREVPWQASMKSTRPSFVTAIADSLHNESEEHRKSIIRDCAGIAYGAAVHTIFGYETVFILAMLLHPHVQDKAQQEIDTVIGMSRLPSLADKPRLPYVSALLKEVLRWHAVAHQGIPHEVKEEDIYRGYRIPKGAMIISNIWNILRDPNIYPSPESFTPERFLKDGMLDVGAVDPSRAAFGFGRRICPGKAFSEDVLFVAFAQILAVFRIDGDVTDPEALCKFSSGAASKVLPFECRLTVRSAEAEALLDS